MDEKPPIERRKGERRGPATRRSPARRTGEPRRPGGDDAEAGEERRDGDDRRRSPRNGRRQRRLDRRIADRRRHSRAFSRAEASCIREILLNPTLATTCPRCNAALSFLTPKAEGGSTFREVRCGTCRCSVVIRDYSVTRILVVDQEESVREALRVILSTAGHEVLGVADGQAALESSRSSPVDVVFVDMLVSASDGLEFIRHFRKDSPDARIVAMAGQRRHGAGDPLALVRRLGPVSILRKPFRHEELLSVLDEALGMPS